MKKTLFVAALLISLTVGKASAQFFMFWDGDMRFGLSAGLSMPMASMPTFKCSAGWGEATMKMVDGSYHHNGLAPSFKLYSGMEKELSGDIAFGFQAWIGLSKNKWNVDFENQSTKDVTTFKVNSSVLDVCEGLYLAYYLTDELSITAGAGISEYMNFHGNASSITCNSSGTQIASVDKIESSNAPFSLGVGYMVNLGTTYNLSDAFFVGANLMYQSSFFSTSSFDENDTFFMNSLGQGVYYSDAPVNSLQLVATIGFRW